MTRDGEVTGTRRRDLGTDTEVTDIALARLCREVVEMKEVIGSKSDTRAIGAVKNAMKEGNAITGAPVLRNHPVPTPMVVVHRVDVPISMIDAIAIAITDTTGALASIDMIGTGVATPRTRTVRTKAIESEMTNTAGIADTYVSPMSYIPRFRR
jgi:hypothetical protein